MQKKLIFSLPSLITLNCFTTFPEYFTSISVIYVLIITLIITSNIYNFLIQHILSNCIAIILFMATYLMYNDDLLTINILTFNNAYINDYFGFCIKITICFFSSVYFLIIANFCKEQKLLSFEYLLLLLFAILGFFLMCNSNDLLTSYLAIELASFSLYILAAFKKTCSYSIDSGLKYFITGAVASTLYLFGSTLLYGFTGSVSFLDYHSLCNCFSSYTTELDFACIWLFNKYKFFKLTTISKIINLLNLYQISTTVSLFNLSILEWGLSLIIFSLFIKLALAPFHLWSLDVFEGSPSSSTFFFAVVSKFSIFVLLFRLCYCSFFSLKNCWQFYSILIGFFSIFVGSLGGLVQRKIKTLLAYSSISHMGYCLIAFSTATFTGIQMFLFYFFVYMASGFLIWYLYLLIKLKNKYLKNKYSKELCDLALLKKSNPGLALCLALIMFSVAGIPPVIGFFAKINIFLSLIGVSFYYLALFSVVFSVAATFYYIRIIKILYFENLLVGKLYYPIKNTKTIFLSFLIFLTIYFFVNPNFLYLVCCKSIVYFL
jgi:NADH-quinone oxidoreductase subunit N